ncbi:hypothetical protein P8A22_36920 [Streptomyces laculatispora]|uniref:Uncharacterized protein n=1 Tax=Streptomyces laculatispora TaxID=887464 RepID=A0ABY9IDJ3_9ACTN|nr:hypothetical protein [Streptomyces laculatispora]WLQ44993.1 hypothetical protein P8A22_36920 [Streptomyces laculatispora]
MRLTNTLSAIAATAMITACAMTAAGPAAAAGAAAPAGGAREAVKQDRTAWTANNCGRNMHIKPAIDNGPDRQCWTTFPGETLKWTWKVGSYGRIAVC